MPIRFPHPLSEEKKFIIMNSYAKQKEKTERKRPIKRGGAGASGHKTMSKGDHDADTLSPEENAAKIQALREMIQNAERTIHGAKAMLLQIEGKKKTGRPRKNAAEEEGGEVVQGTFDGQFMQGADGKQYPVPANYASKSKLVEGDMLKLTITPDGSFIYKQIGPIERRHVIGIVAQDEHGNYQIVAEGRAYGVLLASVTYFKLEPGDEVSILIPREGEARFAAIENVLQKGALVPEEALSAARDAMTQGEGQMEAWKENLDSDEATEVKTPESTTSEEAGTNTTEAGAANSDDDKSVLEEWIRDMEALEKEEAEKEKVEAVAAAE